MVSCVENAHPQLNRLRCVGSSRSSSRVWPTPSSRAIALPDDTVCQMDHPALPRTPQSKPWSMKSLQGAAPITSYARILIHGDTAIF